MKTYEEATEQVKEAFSDLSNDDRLRLAGALVLVLSELEESEYFCLDTDGEVRVVLLTGKSAKHVAEMVKENKFHDKDN